MSVLIDTNILIYHTKGSQIATDFLGRLLAEGTFHISILTKIEFLGWDKHTTEGFAKCRKLIEAARVHPVLDEIAEKAIELKRKLNIRLADAVIAATAIINNLGLATRNASDFKGIDALNLVNPFGKEL